MDPQFLDSDLHSLRISIHDTRQDANEYITVPSESCLSALRLLYGAGQVQMFKLLEQIFHLPVTIAIVLLLVVRSLLRRRASSPVDSRKSQEEADRRSNTNEG